MKKGIYFTEARGGKGVVLKKIFKRSKTARRRGHYSRL